MPVNAVLFDCDGVLVDSEPMSKRLMVDMLIEMGISSEVEQLLESFYGQRMSDCLRTVEDWLGHALPASFLDEFRAREYPMLAQRVTAIPGIHTALTALSVPVAVASNGPLDKIRTTLTATGLLARFGEHIYSAYQIGRFKPDPALYLHAADQLQVDPATCVVVEDSVFGARAGIAAGMRVLGFGENLADLEAVGAIGLSDMSRLPRVIEALEG